MSEFKPDKKFFTILLGVLVVILVAFGLLRMKFGPFLPETIDKNLPDAVIVAAIGIMLWNRQILNKEKKEAEAKKLAEEEARRQAEDEAAERSAAEPAEKDDGAR